MPTQNANVHDVLLLAVLGPLLIVLIVGLLAAPIKMFVDFRSARRHEAIARSGRREWKRAK